MTTESRTLRAQLAASVTSPSLRPDAVTARERQGRLRTPSSPPGGAGTQTPGRPRETWGASLGKRNLPLELGVNQTSDKSHDRPGRLWGRETPPRRPSAWALWAAAFSGREGDRPRGRGGGGGRRCPALPGRGQAGDGDGGATAGGDHGAVMRPRLRRVLTGRTAWRWAGGTGVPRSLTRGPGTRAPRPPGALQGAEAARPVDSWRLSPRPCFFPSDRPGGFPCLVPCLRGGSRILPGTHLHRYVGLCQARAKSLARPGARGRAALRATDPASRPRRKGRVTCSRQKPPSGQDSARVCSRAGFE